MSILSHTKLTSVLALFILGWVQISVAVEPDLPPPFVGNTASGKIGSPFGPRNAESASATRFHYGIDYVPVPGASQGVLIPSFLTTGTLEEIHVRAGTSREGQNIIVRDGSDRFQLLHLFSNGTPPYSSSATDESGNTLYQSVRLIRQKVANPKTNKVLKKACWYIAFTDLSGAVSFAYTTESCLVLKITANQLLTNVKPSAKINQPWIVPVGNSGIAQQTGAHLHLQMKKPLSTNPLRRVEHAHSAGSPPYQISLVSSTPGALAQAATVVPVNIAYSPDLDLDMVSITLPAAFGGSLSGWLATTTWNFGGLAKAARNFTDANVAQQPVGKCSDPSTVPAAGQTLCAEPWKVPNQDGAGTNSKFLVFWVRVDLSAVQPGNYQATVIANSVNRPYAPFALPIAVFGSAPMLALGINSAGTVVGGVCPSGFALGGNDEPCFNLNPNGSQAFAPAVATASIAGNRYTLGSLADLTPCGFDPGQSTVAVAIAEEGSIMVEGGRPESGINDEARLSCLLTPSAPVGGVPHFVATPQSMLALGVNSGGTVVGGVCPSGFALGGDDEPCFNLSSNGSPAFAAATGTALIGGQFSTLSSLANLAPCGFDPGQSVIGQAVSESGLILVEGGKPTSGFNDEARLSCLLTPTTPANGVPRFAAAPLAMLALGVNSAGTVVGGVCPSGFALGGNDEPCFNLNSNGSPAFAAASATASIGGVFYSLSSLANLAPCGFDPGQSVIAVAVSENGSILVEGGRPETGFNDEARFSCLLTPSAPVNGVPHFIAAPL